MQNRLEKAPADLTTLAQRSGGRFPADRVHRVIDGRQETSSHGSREMPVWGFTFQAAGRESSQQEAVQEMILALVDFLESIQVEDKADSD